MQGLAAYILRRDSLTKNDIKRGWRQKNFFLRFLNADCPKIAVENPVSSTVFRMPPHSQEIQLGSSDILTQRKRGCGYGASAVKANRYCNSDGTYVPAGTGRKDRSKYGAAKRGKDAKNRAKTFQGILMQWQSNGLDRA